VHVKDYRRIAVPEEGVKCYPTRDGAYLRETVVGEGDVNFAEVMRLLCAAGYRGAFAMENTHPEPWEDGVRTAMELLKRYEFTYKEKHDANRIDCTPRGRH